MLIIKVRRIVLKGDLFMQIGISSTGERLESPMDQRFGRAPYFILADTAAMSIEVIKNEAAYGAGGAGINLAQNLIDKGVKIVITGNVGPNAMKVLEAAGVVILKGVAGSVEENVEKYKKGMLKKMAAVAVPHFGLGKGGGK